MDETNIQLRFTIRHDTKHAEYWRKFLGLLVKRFVTSQVGVMEDTTMSIPFLASGA